jgi:hypothetical protein
MDNFYNRYNVNPKLDYSNTNITKMSNKTPEENIESISKRYGADFYLALGNLYNSLTGKTLDMNRTTSILDMLMKLKEDVTKQYLFSLLFPEKSKGCRIPTKFPVPSATFQQDDFILVTTNSSGNFVVQWSPQNLSSSTSNNEIVVNNATTLTGLNNDTTYTTSSCLTNSLVTQWQAFRVVSACIVVQYVGSFTNLQGTFGGGLDISNTNTNSYDSNYSNFSNIDDRLWSQQVRVDEGMKICYFPKDYNDLSFIRSNTNPSSNNLASSVRLLLYGQSLPPNTQCVRIDFFKNIEAIPGPAFADIVDVGYLDSGCTNNDPSLDASKLLTNNKLVVTRLDEQDMLDKIMKTSGNDYKNILSDMSLQDTRNSRSDQLKNIYQANKNDSFIPGSFLTRNSGSSILPDSF